MSSSAPTPTTPTAPTTPTYLQVPYAEKDQAKALGARWDPAQRQWYAPAGLALQAFAPWLPAHLAQVQEEGAGYPHSPSASASTELTASQHSASHTVMQAGSTGIGLAELLQGVGQVVATSFDQPVWVRVEVLRVSTKGGHVYLELTERDAHDRVLAKALGMLWANVAAQVLPAFEAATGAQLASGIRLLVLARPVFKAQYGFSLDISAIDSAFTLGQLEAHKQHIRQRLQLEQLLERNRQLPTPWSYQHVLVLSPEDAAGLGDFAADAQRLQSLGLCQFSYVHSRFQGEGAAAQMLQALQTALAALTESVDAQQPALDAIVIIRGGGAVNDLAWLNDYALAQFICTCPLPVLTGIGHERDSTILDEVAHRSFDTPSKVVAAITQTIVQRSQQAQAFFQQIVASSQQQLRQVQAPLAAMHSQLRGAALLQVDKARHHSQAQLRAIAQSSQHHLQQAQQQVPASLAAIRSAAQAHLRLASSALQHLAPQVLQLAARQHQQAQQQLAHTRHQWQERAQQQVQQAQERSQALLREITGQDPQKTLQRGFALVRNAQGQPLMSAAATRASPQPVVLHFADGSLPVRPIFDTDTDTPAP